MISTIMYVCLLTVIVQLQKHSHTQKHNHVVDNDDNGDLVGDYDNGSNGRYDKYNASN